MTACGEGTEVYIDVPGSNGGEGEASEDVVTAGRLLPQELF